MTEQKKPEPGQWWFSEDMTSRAFIVGMSSDGQAVCEDSDGDMGTFCPITIPWHHEPDCDSWTWQPPDWVTQDRVPARPGIDQRRWRHFGDGSLSDWYMTQKGMPLNSHGYVDKFGHIMELRCLRKDLPPVQEVWPKYYETNNPANVAFIRIDKDGTVTCVHIDGSESNDVCGRKYIEGFRKQLTESEALARITKPAEPQPSPLRIYATADDVLYIDTHPRQTTHHEVDLGVAVSITLKEVGNGQNHQ